MRYSVHKAQLYISSVLIAVKGDPQWCDGTHVGLQGALHSAAMCGHGRLAEWLNEEGLLT